MDDEQFSAVGVQIEFDPIDREFDSPAEAAQGVLWSQFRGTAVTD